jgi:hypothetical protein
MTTNKITESHIKQFALELLEKQGYQYIYGPAIAPNSETPERQSFEDVLLLDKLISAVARINPLVPAEIRDDVNELPRSKLRGITPVEIKRSRAWQARLLSIR